MDPVEQYIQDMHEREALEAEKNRYRKALEEIRDKAREFDQEACALFGGDSPQALWAYGLREFIDNTLRDGE